MTRPRIGQLERRILRVAAAGLLPLAILACGVLFSSALEQKRRLLEAHGQTMLALITAVDSELRSSISALQAFAARPQLSADAFSALHEEARLLLSQQPTWINIVISTPEAQQMMNAALPLGGPLPRRIAPDAVKATADTQRPHVGNVVWSTALGMHGVAVHVPYVEDGATRYVLTAVVRPEAFLPLLEQQLGSQQGVIGLLDRSLHFVTRSRDAPQWVGKPPSEGLLKLMRSEKASGAATSLTLEGVPVYSVFHRSAFSGWSAAIGVPASMVDAPLHRAYLLLAVAVGLSVLLGLYAAFVTGRTIVRPIRDLERAAARIGNGGVPEVRTDIPEIAAVGVALGAAHAERERLFAKERDARMAAEAASKQKDEFVAMLGHELRNPLAAISSASLLLAREPLTPRAASAAAIVQRQSRNLARLTDDLLDAGRVILGKIALFPSTVDLAAIAQQVVEAFRNGDRLGRRELLADLQPAWVHGDATRLEQVVTNILANAIRYTPEDGHIRVRVWSADGYSTLEVEDDGIGIEPDLLPRVFDLFVQGERAIDRNTGGLGIGLTLVKRLTELHGGSVRAQSAGAGKGSCFRISLPAGTAPVAQAGPGSVPLGAARIVLVEDNDDMRDSLAALLEAEGHSVFRAVDGIAGLALLRQTPAVDLALVDIGLPGMSGHELVRHVREEFGGTIRCVAMSGYGAPSDVQRGLDAGFDEYLVKPVDLPELQRVIARCRPRT